MCVSSNQDVSRRDSISVLVSPDISTPQRLKALIVDDIFCRLSMNSLEKKSWAKTLPGVLSSETFSSKSSTAASGKYGVTLSAKNSVLLDLSKPAAVSLSTQDSVSKSTGM